MNRDIIDVYLEKYMAGDSSREEEELLRNYFRSADVEPELKFYQALFAYTDSERDTLKKTKLSARTLYRSFRYFAAAAAACLVLTVGLLYFTRSEKPNISHSYAYVDGKIYTDADFVGQCALEALINLDEEDSEIISSQIEIINSILE
ncbi:hypothetical protein LJB98_01570 [Bacteroidales bacterium OttesenSCG-928-M11]|nr:hypothetical protein [Bacteroidales bacterium OttesenSCG-928-M11]